MAITQAPKSNAAPMFLVGKAGNIATPTISVAAHVACMCVLKLGRSPTGFPTNGFWSIFLPRGLWEVSLHPCFACMCCSYSDVSPKSMILRREQYVGTRDPISTRENLALESSFCSKRPQLTRQKVSWFRSDSFNTAFTNPRTMSYVPVNSFGGNVTWLGEVSRSSPSRVERHR